MRGGSAATRTPIAARSRSWSSIDQAPKNHLERVQPQATDNGETAGRSPTFPRGDRLPTLWSKASVFVLARMAVCLPRKRMRIPVKDQNRPWYRDLTWFSSNPPSARSLVNCGSPVVRKRPITNRTVSDASNPRRASRSPAGARSGQVHAPITSSRSYDSENRSQRGGRWDRRPVSAVCLRRGSCSGQELYDGHTSKSPSQGEFRLKSGRSRKILFSATSPPSGLMG